MDTAPRSILIVEDHDVVGFHLRTILPDMQDVRLVRTLAEAQRECGARAPQFVLLDVELPDGDGIDRLPALRAAAPSARFIVVSRHDSAAVVKAAYDNGAAAFLEKGLPMEQLRERLQQAISGVPVFPVVEDTSGVSRREMEVLLVLSSFKSDKDAAQALTIAPDTLRGHLKRIYRKLGVHSRARAVAEARRRHLIP